MHDRMIIKYDMETIKNYIDKNKERFLEELFKFIRIPSVSANEKNKPYMIRAAEYLHGGEAYVSPPGY